MEKIIGIYHRITQQAPIAAINKTIFIVLLDILNIFAIV
jgi:hypothetical protein